MDWLTTPAAVTDSRRFWSLPATSQRSGEGVSPVRQNHMSRQICLVAALLGALLAGAGCTAPPPLVTALSIVPTTPTLIVGDAIELKAVATRSDGSSVYVAASWSVSGGAATLEDAGPRVRGTVPGETTLRAVAEGLSAETVVRVVPRLEGLWSGSFHLVQCQHISGGGPGLCKGWTNGTIGQLQLRFHQQVGPKFSVDVSLSLGDTFGTLAGSVTSDGIVTLEDGNLVSGQAENYLMRFLGFQGSLTSGNLVAKATVERLFPNNWGPQHYRYPATFEARR